MSVKFISVPLAVPVPGTLVNITGGTKVLGIADHRRAHFKPDGTRRRSGGELNGKQANVVGSLYSCPLPRTWSIQHY